MNKQSKFFYGIFTFFGLMAIFQIGKHVFIQKQEEKKIHYSKLRSLDEDLKIEAKKIKSLYNERLDLILMLEIGSSNPNKIHDLKGKKSLTEKLNFSNSLELQQYESIQNNISQTIAEYFLKKLGSKKQLEGVDLQNYRKIEKIEKEISDLKKKYTLEVLKIRKLPDFKKYSKELKLENIFAFPSESLIEESKT